MLFRASRPVPTFRACAPSPFSGGSRPRRRALRPGWVRRGGRVLRRVRLPDQHAAATGGGDDRLGEHPVVLRPSGTAHPPCRHGRAGGRGCLRRSVHAALLGPSRLSSTSFGRPSSEPTSTSGSRGPTTSSRACHPRRSSTSGHWRSRSSSTWSGPRCWRSCSPWGGAGVRGPRWPRGCCRSWPRSSRSGWLASLRVVDLRDRQVANSRVLLNIRASLGAGDRSLARSGCPADQGPSSGDSTPARSGGLGAILVAAVIFRPTMGFPGWVALLPGPGHRRRAGGGRTR